MKYVRPVPLLVSLAVSLAAGAIGSYFTAPALRGWYSALDKPFFNPPNWVFAPVWTFLYLTIGVALYLVWVAPAKDKQGAIGLFGLQLVLNALWPVLFFGLRSPGLGAIGIMGLWIAVFFTIRRFYRINILAGWVLVPYMLWISFAAVLNLSIFLLNL